MMINAIILIFCSVSITAVIILTAKKHQSDKELSKKIGIDEELLKNI